MPKAFIICITLRRAIWISSLLQKIKYSLYNPINRLHDIFGSFILKIASINKQTFAVESK